MAEQYVTHVEVVSKTSGFHAILWAKASTLSLASGDGETEREAIEAAFTNLAARYGKSPPAVEADDAR